MKQSRLTPETRGAGQLGRTDKEQVCASSCDRRRTERRLNSAGLSNTLFDCYRLLLDGAGLLAFSWVESRTSHHSGEQDWEINTLCEAGNQHADKRGDHTFEMPAQGADFVIGLDLAYR